MNNLTPDALAALAVKALERTAFMMADPIPHDPARLAAARRCSAITYSGPESGRVVLRATDDFLKNLAASLLGVEPGEIDLASCGDDAIKELTNILGGSVILALGGRECTYTLGLPQLTPPPPAPAPERTCCLDCEGHLLFITWEPAAVAAVAAA